MSTTRATTARDAGAQKSRKYRGMSPEVTMTSGVMVPFVPDARRHRRGTLEGMVAKDALLLPPRVGRYEPLVPLGSGGMATVYLARAKGAGGFEREVALKLTHPHLRDEPGLAADLLEEGKVAARIRHPNVVPVLDVGEDPYGIFLVMEYVEGEVLSAILRGGAPPRPIALRILVDALAGLHAAHETKGERGEPMHLVHRDFSPQNILVGTDGVTRLTDFGIAKVSTRPGVTKTGLVKGKIAYMAPEHARGLPMDRRADVWAAGVVAWELLSGKRLYSTADEMATLLRIVQEVPPRVRTVAPDLPEDIDDVIAAALTPDVASRLPSADAFRRGLDEAWRRHDRIAEQEEVAVWVRDRVAPKLAQMRERIERLGKLRTKMDRLIDVEHDPTEDSAPTETTSAERSRTQRIVHAGPTLVTPAFVPEVSAPSPGVALPPPPKRAVGRGVVALGVVAGVVLVGVVGFGALRVLAKPSPPAAVVTATATAEVPPPPASATEAPPEAPRPTAAAATTTPPATTATPIKPPKPQVTPPPRVRATATTPRPQATPSPAPLATDTLK